MSNSSFDAHRALSPLSLIQPRPHPALRARVAFLVL
jgi:hypothetical protein